MVNWKSKFQFVRVSSTVCEKLRWKYHKLELSLTNSMDKIQKQCYDSVKQGVDGKKGANYPEVKISFPFCKGNFHPWVEIWQLGWWCDFRELRLQQSGCQIDAVRLNAMSIELCQNITPVEKAEQLVCRPIVQLFPFIGVDVVHHQINIFLLKLV